MFSQSQIFRCLANPIFARLYSAQTINLIGDALTWLGLALLAFEIAGENAGVILSGALTLRVVAYVVLSPVAGAIADRVDRKLLMVLTHLMRMGLICLFPFINQPWQVYATVLALNVFSAFFMPTYKATIPLVVDSSEYPQAIALSSATYQILGVLGPGIAGSVAALVGTRQIFFLDALTFLIAALLILSLPGKLRVPQVEKKTENHRTWQDLQAGTICLFRDPLIRYALVMQLVAAIIGATILINTVGYVQGTLQLDKLEYGWTMAAFGLGASLAAVGLSVVKQTRSKLTLTTFGAVLISLAIFPANWVGLNSLLILWLLAGVGQTLINVPTQVLIADRVDVNIQGRVYGAHFAWSHFWWAIAYPLTGWMGSNFPLAIFFNSSLIGLAVLGGAYVVLRPSRQQRAIQGKWHEHEHNHDQHHQHQYYAHSYENVKSAAGAIAEPHRHLHFHDA
ncbi:MAG: MFS transporter [Cyanobacteria bacterium P01_D01_bin.73]